MRTNPNDRLAGVTIYGESAEAIISTLLTFEVSERGPDGLTRLRGALSDPSRPFSRAMFRAEAELLCRDADAMTAGTYEARKPGQRRHDALLSIMKALQQNLGAERRPLAG